MDSNVTVTGDNNASPMSHSTSDTNTRSEKHSRSKSQNFQYDHDAILSKHFDRSLNHSKSKSLPRPMTERGLPSSFFIEQNSSSSENLSKNRNEASRIRTRIRTKSKDQIAKSNSLSNRMNKIKSEPLSPMSPSHPSQQQPPMHHRSRSCPIQPITSVHPRVPARVKHQMPVPSPEASIPRSVDIEIDTNRIRLPPNWAIENQNGILYFVDHASNTTTYTDPRIEIKKNLIQQHNQLSLQNNPAELAEGFERRVTENMQIFYVNHNTRKTSWIHPKIESLLIPEEELNNKQWNSQEQNQYFYNQQNSMQSCSIMNGLLSEQSNPLSDSGMNSANSNSIVENTGMNTFDSEFNHYVKSTVGFAQARIMNHGSSSSLPANISQLPAHFQRFNPLAATNRKSPNHYTSRPETKHRRQRSLDQLRFGDLNLNPGIGSNPTHGEYQDFQQRSKDSSQPDLDLIKEIENPAGFEMPDHIRNQLINDVIPNIMTPYHK